MRLSKDWILKNWDFLSTRWIRKIHLKQPTNPIQVMLWNSDIPIDGKFYGTTYFLMHKAYPYHSESPTGTIRVLLRPYITAPLPEGIQAVYINPKNYKFNDQSEITGLKSTYEQPIVVFHSGI